MRFQPSIVAAYAALILFAALPFQRSASAEDTGANAPVIVFAAASLKNALDAVSAAWQRESGKSVKISYAASSTLAKQLTEDAPAQIFVSADEDWMDYVASKDLLKAGSRSDLLGNKLVLIAPKDSATVVDLKASASLSLKSIKSRHLCGHYDRRPGSHMRSPRTGAALAALCVTSIAATFFRR